MPTFEASFRNLYLNQRIDAQTPLIPRAEWMGCKGDYIIKPDEGLYLALDLSGAQDLTSLTGCLPRGKDSRVKAWFLEARRINQGTRTPRQSALYRMGETRLHRNDTREGGTI